MVYYGGIGTCILLWALTSAILRPGFYLKGSVNVWLIISLVAYMALMMALTGNHVFIKRHLGLFLIYYFAIIFLFYRRYYPDLLAKLFWVILLIVPVWSILTIRALFTMPFVARLSGERYEPYMLQGIGNYSLVYAMILIGVCTFYAALYGITISYLQRGYLYALSAISVVLAVLAGYTIGLGCLFAAVCVFCVSRKGYVRLTFNSIVLMLLLGSLAFGFGSLVIAPLRSIVVGTPYELKLEDFEGRLSGDASEHDTVTARQDVYETSLESLAEHPVLGTIASKDAAFGNHSTVLDTFSLFGVFIGMANLYVLIFVPYRALTNRKRRFSSIALTTVVIALVFQVFDNSTDAFAVSMFFVFPYVLSLIPPRIEAMSTTRYTARASNRLTRAA